VQLTINVKDAVADKVLYLLESLKSDIQIIKKQPTSPIEIDTISKDDSDYDDVLKARKERANHPEAYVSLNEVNWG